MTVKILNMRESTQYKVKAEFDAEIGAWRINRCVIIETDPGKGSYRPNDYSCSFLALAPLVAPGVRSVKIPDEHFYDFVNAAIDAFIAWSEKQDEPDDAGVMRFLGADDRAELRAEVERMVG